MTLKPALPMLALALSSCASNPAPKAIPVLAQQHQCATYPLPPASLLKPPARIDFLPPPP